jgi:hypothetical protein
MFRELFKKFFLYPIPQQEGDLKSYIQKLESGEFKDKMVYGISNQKKGFMVLDPVQQPGALYCGGMGSGKSIAMRFTLATHIAANSENTFYILFDSLKGMTDYSLMFDGKEIDMSKNVVAALNDTSKIVPVINMIYDECMKRKEEFTKVGAKNIYEFDQKNKQQDPNSPQLARIILAMEEFHNIPNSEYVKFHMKVDQPGTVAAKLKELMRVGRSYGIQLLLATQRAISEDVPSQIKPGITLTMVFRMNNPGEAAGVNVPHAIEIGMEQRGRCGYDSGGGESNSFIQYPYLPDEPLLNLLKKYYKPLKAKLLNYQVEDFKTALEGDGNSGMVQVMKLGEVVKFHNQFKFEDIATRFLKIFKYQVEVQPNPAYLFELIATKNGKKHAVKLYRERSGGMGSGNKKEAENLKKISQMIGCDGGIIVFGLEYPIPNTVSNLEKENKELYKIMESEDLLQIGNIIDNKEALEEKGKFKEMYLQFPLADESDLESVVETKKVQKKDEVIEKKIEPVKEEVQSIDYSYLLDRGFINDRAYMQSVIFNSKLIINGLTDDERQKIISKLQLHKDNKLISIKELESKNLINDNIYMKKLINDPKVIIIGLSDELKNKINNYVEKKIENKVSSDDDLKNLQKS